MLESEILRKSTYSTPCTIGFSQLTGSQFSSALIRHGMIFLRRLFAYCSSIRQRAELSYSGLTKQQMHAAFSTPTAKLKHKHTDGISTMSFTMIIRTHVPVVNIITSSSALIEPNWNRLTAQKLKYFRDDGFITDIMGNHNVFALRYARTRR